MRVNKFRSSVADTFWFLVFAHVLTLIGFYAGPVVKIYWSYTIWFNISVAFFFLLERYK